MRVIVREGDKGKRSMSQVTHRDATGTTGPSAKVVPSVV
jgi:hypothetical protein